MRWSIVRLIWFRELRDQLRDRRTVFVMAVLPLLLYPALGFGVLQFALGFINKPSVVGIYGGENLTRPSETECFAGTAILTAVPTGTDQVIARIVGAAVVARIAAVDPRPLPAAGNPAAAASWFAAIPSGSGSGLDRFIAAVALAHLGTAGLGQEYPPLILVGDEKHHFAPIFFESAKDAITLQVRFLEWSGHGVSASGSLLSGYTDWPQAVDRTLLDSKQVDLLLIVPPDFRARLEADERPVLYVLSREGDDRSRLVSNRVHGILARWKKRIKEIRLLRRGLSPNYDDPVVVRDNEKAKSLEKRAAEELFDILVRIFPFVLVMWALAGALYPAVDLCAGEKERGTMETLLISPASREEIVWGKFLTIWVFSAATALLNLGSMGVTAGLFGGLLPQELLRPASVLWCVVLVLPLAAFFSAICLAVGAYARSSKEGQHYLMPLFLFTMPLIFLTLSPGVELNPFYSLVPVTGVALLLQRLMAAPSLDHVPWLYFLPVLAPMVLYGWLALRWAIEQFKREEVLFREAERIDLGLWLRMLLRAKEALPSTGHAVACFALIVFLHWLSLGLGGKMPLVGRSSVSLLAFVAAPTLFMALLLTTRPAQTLGLRMTTGRSFGAAALLAVLLLPPLSELTLVILRQFPGLVELLSENNPLTAELKSLGGEGRVPMRPVAMLQYMLVFVVLPAVCEELAFRGLILSGLRRRFQPWMAIVLSSFLFALYHFNVFQFLPAFVLGMVLGLLAVRSGSVLPGMLFHLLHNGMLIGFVLLEAQGWSGEALPAGGIYRLVFVSLCALAALMVVARLAKKPFECQPEFPTQGASLPLLLLRKQEPSYASSPTSVSQ
jgi:sodium transport system permease protein